MTEVEQVTPIDMEFKDVPIESPKMHVATGKPGSGKTVLDFSIADIIHEENDKDIYVIMKPYDRKLKQMAPGIPKHIKELRDLTRLSDESDNPLQDVILIGDDWKRIAHARRAMSDINVVVDNLIGILRHDELDIVLDDQTASSIDKNNIIRSNYLWVKPPFRKELELGRNAMLEEITLAFNLDMGQRDVLLYNEEVHDGPVFVHNIPLPSYWTEELSRMHRRQPRGFMRRLEL